MRSLPIFVRLTDRPVILLGHGPAAEAKARLLERAGARLVDEAAQAALAVVAIEDEGEALAAVARLKARGILVNAVDRADLCDFTLPAIVDRDPVLIAIGTGGVSAGLAAALRQRLETLLPAGLGRVAEALHAARATLRARFPDMGARRRAIEGMLAPGGALDPLADHAAPTVPDAAIGDAPRLARIRLTSPDPDDLTLRQARLLATADRIHHGHGTPPAILDRARADAERIAAPPPPAPLPGLTIVLED